MTANKVYTEADLTPGEHLVMEVLAARWRLGEHIWTFDSSGKRWVNSLADKGLVTVMHGMVENTVRAGLTADGLRFYWQDDHPDCGETGKAGSTTLVDAVPKKWVFSKKKSKRRLARLAHPTLRA